VPSRPVFENGRRFFVATGTEKYANLGENMDLPSVVHDLERIREFFKSQNCIHALEGIGLNPTLEQLKDDLGQWAQRELKEGDIVAFYYSGHGAKTDHGYYLPLRYSSERDLARTAVPVSELAKWAFLDTPARQIIIIIDACYSGRGAEELIGIAQKLAETTTGGARMFVIAAAGTKDEAEEGTFSKAFCEVLANRDGSIGWHTQPYIFAEALTDPINDLLREYGSQQQMWLTSRTTESCRLFRNPFFSAKIPPGLDIHTQERVERHLAVSGVPQTRDAEIWPAAGLDFIGRKRALTEIVRWLAAPTGDGKVRVITGRPGAGKSALLNYLVHFSEPRRRPETSQWPGEDFQPILSADNIDVAVNLRQRTLEDVVRAMAKQIDLETADANGFIAMLLQRNSTVIVVDAVDEALESKDIIANLLIPLVHLSSVRLIVGMRPNSPDGHVTALGGNVVEINLSSSDYFDPQDMLEYVRHRLLRANYVALGQEQQQHAEAIAAKAGNIFLIARLLCDNLIVAAGTGRQTVSIPDTSASVPAAFDEYLSRFDAMPGFSKRVAIDLLTPLAWAEGEGLPWETIWPRLASAISNREYADADIRRLLDHAGAYIVEANENERSVYRLYHEALSEHIRSLADAEKVQRSISDTLKATIRHVSGSTSKDWAKAHPYIRSHLAVHAARAGILDDLMGDPGFLLFSNPTRLLRAAQACRTTEAKETGSLYQRAMVYAKGQSTAELAAYFRMLLMESGLEQLAQRLEAGCDPASWSCRWTSWRRVPQHFVLSKQAQGSTALSIGFLSGHPVILSGDSEGLVSCYDAETCQVAAEPIRAASEPIVSMAYTTVRDRPAVAIVAGNGSFLRVVDLESGALLEQLQAEVLWKFGHVVTCRLNGRPVAITGADNGTVRCWELDPALRSRSDNLLIRHPDCVTTLAAANIGDRAIILSGARDGSVRIWDLSSASLLGSPDIEATQTEVSTTSWVFWTRRETRRIEHPVQMAALIPLPKRTVAVTVSGSDFYLWDVDRKEKLSGASHIIGSFGHPMTAIASSGRIIGIGGNGRTALWDFESGQSFELHDRGAIGRPVAGSVGQNTSVACVGTDGVLRLWQINALEEARHQASKFGYGDLDITVGRFKGRNISISIKDTDTLRFLDTETGRPARAPICINDSFVSLEACRYGETDGRPYVLASYGFGAWVFDLESEEQFHIETELKTGLFADNQVVAIASGYGENRALFAVVDESHVLFIFDAASLNRLKRIQLSGRPEDLHIVELPDGLAAVTVDGYVTVWDVESGRNLREGPLGDGDVVRLATLRSEGRVIAAGVQKGAMGHVIPLWDLASYRRLHDLRSSSNNSFSSVALGSCSGQAIAAAGDRAGDLHLFHVDSGAVLARIHLDCSIRALACDEGMTLVATDRGIVALSITAAVKGVLT
jgi:WD40 repeat protein